MHSVNKAVPVEYVHGTPLGLFMPPEPYLGPGQLGYVQRAAVRTVDKGLRGITYHRDIPILPRDPPNAPRPKPRFSVAAGAWCCSCIGGGSCLLWGCTELIWKLINVAFVKFLFGFSAHFMIASEGFFITTLPYIFSLEVLVTVTFYSNFLLSSCIEICTLFFSIFITFYFPATLYSLARH